MSPVSLTLDLLLAALLLITLIFGLRLDKRLKALNAGQAEFQAAIADLDRAAARAETGLAELRRAMDEAVDLLGERIDKARELAAKLDALTLRGQSASEQAGAGRAPGSQAQRSSLDRLWPQPPADARREPDPALSLARPSAAQPPRAAPKSASRSSTVVDDELFDAPALRRIAGLRS